MKTPILLWVSTLLLIFSSFSKSVYAQGPCNTPVRPITGVGGAGTPAPQHPCEGDTVIYQIANVYESYEWKGPRAMAGDPEGAGWEILAAKDGYGQGFNKIKIRVGKKAGTMVVTVVEKNCGTKVATIPVKPGKNFEAFIQGPDSVCVNEPITYFANVKKNNGQGNISGEFVYQWTVPQGWIVQGSMTSEQLVVIPGTLDGEVNLYVTDNTEVSGNGNNGTGLGGYKAGYCGTAAAVLFVKTNENCGSACTKPSVELVAPNEICNLDDEPTLIRVDEVEVGVTYVFNLPEGFIVLDQGPGFVYVVAAFDESQFGNQTITVTASNACGSDNARAVIKVKDCGPGTPFPVTMTSFTGVSRNGAIELAWSTASEINNDKFEVERSQNGKDFQKVGEVKGSGNSTVAVSYSYTDRFRSSGTVYYRLKQIDFDKAFEYSKVIALNHSATSSGTMSIVPNPVTNGEFKVSFDQASKGGGTIRILDMTGRQVYSQEVSGNSSEASLNVGHLNLRPGIYIISVGYDGRSTTQRVMIQ